MSGNASAATLPALGQIAFQELLQRLIEPVHAEFGGRMSLLDLRVFLTIASRPDATTGSVAEALGLPQRRVERSARHLAMPRHWWQRGLGLISLTRRADDSAWDCRITMKGALVARCLYLRYAVETGRPPV